MDKNIEFFNFQAVRIVKMAYEKSVECVRTIHRTVVYPFIVDKTSTDWWGDKKKRLNFDDERSLGCDPSLLSALIKSNSLPSRTETREENQFGMGISHFCAVKTRWATCRLSHGRFNACDRCGMRFFGYSSCLISASKRISRQSVNGNGIAWVILINNILLPCIRISLIYVSVWCFRFLHFLLPCLFSVCNMHFS